MARSRLPGPATLLELYQRTILVPFSGCLIWSGRIVRGGYGLVWVGRERAAELGTPHNVLAHRLAWMLARGPIPKGMQIDHRCRSRCCVNVDHLDLVTPSENVRRGLGPALSAGRMRKMVRARARATTHCPKGHEYTPANTYLHNGCRTCRECQRVRVRDYRTRQAAHDRSPLRKLRPSDPAGH